MTLANYFSKNGINGNSVNDRYVEFDLGVFAWYEQRHVVVSAGHGTIRVYAKLSYELRCDQLWDLYRDKYELYLDKVLRW